VERGSKNGGDAFGQGEGRKRGAQRECSIRNGNRAVGAAAHHHRREGRAFQERRLRNERHSGACSYVPPTQFSADSVRRALSQGASLRALSATSYTAKSKVNVAVVLKAFPQYENNAAALFANLVTAFGNSDFVENLYQAAVESGAATVLTTTYTGSEFSAVDVVAPPAEEDDSTDTGSGGVGGSVAVSVGAIVGITVAAALVLLAAVAGAYWSFKRSSRSVHVVRPDDSHGEFDRSAVVPFSHDAVTASSGGWRSTRWHAGQ
jgi:hypothetical protein